MKTAHKQGGILCVGLTPAYQRTLFFDDLHVGDINRTQRVIVGAAGKGINVARALTQLEQTANVLTFLGGDTGSAVADDLAQSGIGCAAIHTSAPTRICQTLVDESAGTATELIEESSCPTKPEWGQLLASYQRVMEDASMVVISGTLMPGAMPDIYAELSRVATAHGKAVLIDSHGEPLKRALAARPWLLKMNVHELAMTVEHVVENDADLARATRELMDRGGQSVLITRGPHPAFLAQPETSTFFELPRIVPVSAIASGDCVSAGIAYGHVHGQTLEDSVRLGLGCGIANALTSLPARFAPNTARQYATDLVAHPA